MTDEQRKELLETIQDDPMVDRAELAVRLGMDAAETQAEVQRLEANGMIKAYRAIIDWDRLEDAPIYAFVDVHVKPEPDSGFDAIARRIALFDEVHSLYLISGGKDLLVVVEGGDFKEVALFVAEKLSPLKGVESTGTSFVLRKYKKDGELLLSATEDTRLAIAP
ncbi:MAG: Lrp/AsnC family transcriptional regulator [Armatimonadetes bacterium]|nr:Lrp/AsnC family transcriptional regulator [Armatimonadota bacterium]